LKIKARRKAFQFSNFERRKTRQAADTWWENEQMHEKLQAQYKGLRIHGLVFIEGGEIRPCSRETNIPFPKSLIIRRMSWIPQSSMLHLKSAKCLLAQIEPLQSGTKSFLLLIISFPHLRYTSHLNTQLSSSTQCVSHASNESSNMRRE
jgi:hypothetical protein